MTRHAAVASPAASLTNRFVPTAGDGSVLRRSVRQVDRSTVQNLQAEG
jgi:hypothetical protein